jgi:hypothetical protein
MEGLVPLLFDPTTPFRQRHQVHGLRTAKTVSMFSSVGSSLIPAFAASEEKRSISWVKVV